MKIGVGHAHAKVILMGEHSVVYQHPALAIPFKALTIKVSIMSSSHTWIDSQLFKGELEFAPKILEPITMLIRSLQTHFQLQDLKITIDSNIPLGAGLGSSAALASAITKAFFNYMQLPIHDDDLFQWIQSSETMAHGQPSGVDALTTSHNVAWWYIKGQTPVSLPFSLNAVLIIAQTTQIGSTKQAIQIVSDKIKEEGMITIDKLGTLTKLALHAIEEKDIVLLGQYLSEAHSHLKHLGVSTPILDQYVELALSHKALGAKLTGGGLGGCMIALAQNQDQANDIVHALKTLTPHVWSLSLL